MGVLQYQGKTRFNSKCNDDSGDLPKEQGGTSNGKLLRGSIWVRKDSG